MKNIAILFTHCIIETNENENVSIILHFVLSSLILSMHVHTNLLNILLRLLVCVYTAWCVSQWNCYKNTLVKIGRISALKILWPTLKSKVWLKMLWMDSFWSVLHSFNWRSHNQGSVGWQVRIGSFKKSFKVMKSKDENIVRMVAVMVVKVVIVFRI